MQNEVNTQKSSSKPEANKALMNLPNSEWLTTLHHIHSAQLAMNQFTIVMGNEPIETITQVQATLTSLSNKIIEMFVSGYTQNYREAVQIWENEGGRIE